MLKYPISAIFGPTLQGEGHFVGYRCGAFVRFGGCSVRECSIRQQCDEAPWKVAAMLSAAEITQEVRRLAEPGNIVVLSGGEPTDYDLPPIVDHLRAAGFRLHMETSGVRSVAGLPIEWLTVSPKTPDYAQRMGHTLKVVVRPEWSWPDIVRLDEGTTFFHRYLQPLTDPVTGRAINLQAVVEMLISTNNEGGRWALSTQSHRLWGVR